MKKRYFLLVPLAFLLVIGSLMVPVKAASVNDPEGDLVGMSQWSEEGNPRFDCKWMPTEFNASIMDIESIEWVENGLNYSITIDFYGNVSDDSGYFTNDSIEVYIFFLVNGSVFPDEMDVDVTGGEVPDANLFISSTAGGSALGGIPAINVMEIIDDTINWNFPQSILNVTPVALDSWDLTAISLYVYEDGNYTNIALDHYNFDYVAEMLLAFCNLVNLDIPGYSIIAIGVVAVITIGVIIKKKHKK